MKFQPESLLKTKKQKTAYRTFCDTISDKVGMNGTLRLYAADYILSVSADHSPLDILESWKNDVDDIDSDVSDLIDDIGEKEEKLKSIKNALVVLNRMTDSHFDLFIKNRQSASLRTMKSNAGWLKKLRRCLPKDQKDFNPFLKALDVLRDVKFNDNCFDTANEAERAMPITVREMKKDFQAILDNDSILDEEGNQ